jgi:hypothetical protein
MRYETTIPLSLMVRYEPPSDAEEEEAEAKFRGHYGWAVVSFGETEVVKLPLDWWDEGEVSPRGALEAAAATWLASRFPGQAG